MEDFFFFLVIQLTENGLIFLTYKNVYKSIRKRSTTYKKMGKTYEQTVQKKGSI